MAWQLGFHKAEKNAAEKFKTKVVVCARSVCCVRQDSGAFACVVLVRACVRLVVTRTGECT